MSVVRKGPKATAVKVLTYVVLVVVAIIVIFPFFVAFTNSFKRSDDISRFPPSLVPRTAAVRVVDGKEQPLYTLPGRSGQWAVVENGASIGIYVNPADPSQSVTLKASDAKPTGKEITVDGESKPLFTITVDGQPVEWYRKRATIGAVFESTSNPDEKAVGLVLDATPVERFSPRFANYSDVYNGKNLRRSLTNTAFVTILVVLGQVFTSILGGYVFARLTFKGRDALFLVYLGSVMIPFVVLIIPLYQFMVKLGWVDNLVALIIPFIFTAYGTFLMRQFFINIPVEIEEAALLDGASRWTILWRVFVPLARPAIATLCTFGFLYAWNSFVWPLVIINSGNQDNLVLSLALSTLGGRGADSPSLVFAGVMIAMAPPVLVFLFAQRYFVENQATSGMK